MANKESKNSLNYGGQLFYTFSIVIASHDFFNVKTNEGTGNEFFSPFVTARYFLARGVLEASALDLENLFGARMAYAFARDLAFIWMAMIVIVILSQIYKKYRPGRV